MSNVGYATLQIIPSARGFGAALNSATLPATAAAGTAGGKALGGSLTSSLIPMAKRLGVISGGLAVGGIIKSSIDLEKNFSQTMNTMAAVADVPKAQIKSLSDLAMKMGADTVFSANDAADAMLELAKGGMSAATIQGGALKQTLTLATAGGLGLGAAATYMSNSLNTFHLTGKDAATVAAALAGGANASSASVESLGQALGQVGPGAKNAGLSIQETVAALSAFDNAGIKGSDAGTSLKTMLARLVPQTDKAKGAMEDLGLSFVNADGSFKSISEIAGQLHDKLGGLSEAQRTTALQTIFGSDASRAASVLMDQGREGIEKMIRATSDLGAAQRVADSRMKGTAGAIEQMKGSIETAELALGKLLAPAIQAGALGIASAFNAITPAINNIVPGIKALYDLIVRGDFTGAFAKIFHVEEDSALIGYIFQIRDAFKSIADFLQPIVVPAFNAIAGIIRDNLHPILIGFGVALANLALPVLFGAISTAVGALVGAIGLLFSPIIVTTVAITALVAGVIYAWQHFETFRNIVTTVASAILSVVTTSFNAVKSFLGSTIDWIRSKFDQFMGWARPTWSLFWNFLKDYIPPILGVLKGSIEVAFAQIKAVFDVALGVIKAVWTVAWTLISTVLKVAWTSISTVVEGSLQIIGGIIRTALALLTGNWSQAWEGIKQILRGAWTMIEGAVKAGIQLVLGLFRDLPASILKALGSLAMTLYQAGRDLLAGMAKGIADSVGSVVSAVKDAVGSVVSSATSALGIHSPSRVFAEIGRYTGEGFALGIESMTNRAQDAMAAMVAPPSVADVEATFGTSGTSSVAGGTATVVDAVVSLADQIEGLRAEVRRQTDRGLLLTQTGVKR